MLELVAMTHAVARDVDNAPESNCCSHEESQGNPSSPQKIDRRSCGNEDDLDSNVQAPPMIIDETSTAGQLDTKSQEHLLERPWRSATVLDTIKG
jgi:hypothetical protein